MNARRLRSLAACSFFFAPSFVLVASAGADEPPPEAAAKEEASSSEPKTKVTAFGLPHPDVSDAQMVEVMRAVENGLKKNPRLEFKDLDTRLADFAQETPTDQIEAARAALKDGQKALLELRIPDAVQKLDEAVQGLAKVLPYIKKQELADAQALLAVAQFEGGDKKAGHDAFVELLTWRPDYAFDPQKLPPKYAGPFDDAQRQMEKAKKAPVTIHSTPEGAQAYVDGKYIGVTPCTTEPLPTGKHYVTLKREGYKKAVQPVVVQKKGEARGDLTLERSEKYLLVEQARAKVEATLGAETIDPESENLKAVLFIDQAVFVKAQAASGGKIAVDTFLYDLRNHHRLSKVHQVTRASAVEPGLATAADLLYKNVNYEGELAAPEDKPPEMAKPKRFYQTWWFWTAAGATVVVAGGAVGTYYAVQASQPAPCPTGDSCLQFGP